MATTTTNQSSVQLSQLSRGLGTVRQNGHERIDVQLPEDRYSRVCLSERCWPAKDPGEELNMSSSSRNVVVHKTYSTRRGPLLLFSEELADRRLKRHLANGEETTTANLRTVDELAWAVLTYGCRTSECQKMHLDFVKLDRWKPGVRPGFSAKRYLSRLTRSFDDRFLDKLINNGSVLERTLFVTNELFPRSRRRRIDDDLSSTPSPYRILQRMLQSPGLLSGFYFFHDKQEEIQPTDSMAGGPTVTDSSKSGVFNIGIRQSNRTAAVTSYGQLTSEQKENALADLLVKSLIDQAINSHIVEDDNGDTGNDNSQRTLETVDSLNMVDAIQAYVESQTAEVESDSMKEADVINGRTNRKILSNKRSRHVPVKKVAPCSTLAPISEVGLAQNVKTLNSRSVIPEIRTDENSVTIGLGKFDHGGISEQVEVRRVDGAMRGGALKPVRQTNPYATVIPGVKAAKGTVVVMPGGEVVSIGQSVAVADPVSQKQGHKTKVVAHQQSPPSSVGEMIRELTEHARQIAAITLTQPGTGQNFAQDAMTIARSLSQIDNSRNSEMVDDYQRMLRETLASVVSASGSADQDRLQDAEISPVLMEALLVQRDLSADDIELAVDRRSGLGVISMKSHLSEHDIVPPSNDINSRPVINISIIPASACDPDSVHDEGDESQLDSRDHRSSQTWSEPHGRTSAQILSVHVDGGGHPAGHVSTTDLRDEQALSTFPGKLPTPSPAVNLPAAAAGEPRDQDPRSTARTATVKPTETDGPGNVVSSHGDSGEGIGQHAVLSPTRIDTPKPDNTLDSSVDSGDAVPAGQVSNDQLDTELSPKDDRQKETETGKTKVAKKSKGRAESNAGKSKTKTGSKSDNERTNAQRAAARRAPNNSKSKTSRPVNNKQTTKRSQHQNGNVTTDFSDAEKRTDGNEMAADVARQESKDSDDEAEFAVDRDETSDVMKEADRKQGEAYDDEQSNSTSGAISQEMRAAQREARAIRRREEAERKRRDREEKLKMEREEAARRQEMARQLELERLKREEEYRLAKEKRESALLEEEEAERLRRWRMQEDADREARLRDEYRRKLAEIKRKQEEEERLRREAEERERREMEEATRREELLLLEMTDAERLEYERRKLQELELRKQQEDDERRRREIEKQLAAQEALRLAQELAQRREAVLRRIEFNRSVMVESTGLARTQDVSRAFVYSYAKLVEWLRPPNAGGEHSSKLRR